MPQPKAPRRTSPVTYVLGVILFIGFVSFIFNIGTSSQTSAAARKLHTALGRQKRRIVGSKDPASNILSPPSLPFLKPKDPSAPEIAPPVVHYHLTNVTATANPLQNRETILILTPLSKFYIQYWENLLNLDYPHDLISLGFIIPKDTEGNAATKQLQEEIQKTQEGPDTPQKFASITILRQDFDPPLTSQLEVERHALSRQKLRREGMAKARNSLLFTTLGPTTSWVLWLDGDIIETPASLIQDLALHDKPVIVPNCYQRFFNPDSQKMDIRPYDFNSWVDSDIAKDLASKMDKDDILLEGYAELPTYRSLMALMPDQHKGELHTEVALDGVGGTALLVKAEVHRDGAMFPPFAFFHLIETEGFAKMAKRLGWGSWGLPFYYVYHYNE